MNTARIAAALNTISLAFGELAEALNDSQAVALPPATPAHAGAAPARAGLPPAPASEPSPFEDETVTWEPPDTLPAEPQGSLTACPLHHVAFKDGKFGKYCPRLSDNEAWRNAKGYCSITPKNVAEYLRITAAVPA